MMKHVPLYARSVLSLAILASFGQAAMAQAQPVSTLAPIVVRGQAANQGLAPAAPGGQAATGASVGILGNMDVMETPFSVTSYTSQLMTDQRARTVADVLANDPSVRKTTNTGHMFEHFTVRGLEVAGTDLLFNGLAGIAPYARVPVEFLERVEVLRGPNALIGGMSPGASLGGTINLVPKRAGSTPLTELTASYSSESYGQAHIDLGRRFGEEQRLGLRFNGVYGTGETGVEDQKQGRRLAALGLDYRGDDWKASLDTYYVREEVRNGSPAMYNFTRLGEVITPPNSSSNMFRDTKGVQEDKGIMLRGEVELTDHLSAYAAFGAANANGDGLMFGTRSIVTDFDGTALGYVYNVGTRARNRSVETGLNAEFTTGSVSHTVRLSAAAASYKEWVGNRANAGFAQNIYDPVTPVFPASPDNLAATQDNRMTSLALADTLGFANDRVLLTLGARLQRIDQKLLDYDESAVTPAIAVLVKPWGEDTALYANYVEGLSQGEVVPIYYDNAGESFKPFKTRQFEMGVKLRRGDATHTLSAFQIDKPSTLVAGNTLVDGGEQRNRGLEWTVIGKATKSVSVLGGVTYLQAKQRNTVGNYMAGSTIFGSPRWTANLGTEWTTPVQGLSVSGRMVYTGRQWLDSGNTVELPSWTRFDAGAKYETRLGNTPVTLYAYVENLFDRDYWEGTFSDSFATLSAPRTLRLAATFAF